MSRRSLDWSAALRDIRSDRDTLPAIREERLRTTAGLRADPPLSLTAWRGRSGKRYVAAIHDLTLDALEQAGPAVCLAVHRDPAGVACIVEAASGMTRVDAVDWLCRAHRAGASELHVHRLAETSIGRAVIVADLIG